MINNQVVSKERVTNHGEVYTHEREVNAMLDLVKHETERIDSRFLEPACGTGNFLSAVLERKLQVVEDRYKKSQLEYERYAIIAVSSIYGIDILQDNVIQCRKRLFDIFLKFYSRLFNIIKDEYRNAVTFILKRNIIWGDALTLKTVDEKPKPIVFSEWSPVNGNMIKRRDFLFSDLIPGFLPPQKELFPEPDLFSNLDDKVFIPKEKKSYKPVHYLKIGENEEFNQ